MAKDDNINDILVELNNVLSKLTGEERKSVAKEFRPIPKKISESAQVKTQVSPVAEQSLPLPEEPAAVPLPAKETVKEVSVSKIPSVPKMLKASAPVPLVSPRKEKSEAVKPQIEVQTSAASPEIEKQTVVEQGEKPKPSEKQKIDEPKENKNEAAGKPSGNPEKDKISRISSDISPEQIFRLSCYYPAGSAGLIDIFFQNLADVLQKTTKKRYYMSREIIAEADYSVLNLNKAVSDAKEMRSDAVFFISNEPIEFEAEGIYCRNVLSEQVKKRFFYVDLIVELVLAKKK